jgi:argininosuccinate lyase
MPFDRWMKTCCANGAGGAGVPRRADLGVLMPGYTHMQRAQPILLSHWWLSHFWPLARPAAAVAAARPDGAVLPLGSGALAGRAVPRRPGWPWLRRWVSSVSPNSLDAVSDRDFAVNSCLLPAGGVHLSRMAEMLIMFSTAEFGFVELSDTYSTGSSLMPQKKNPDTLELTRGKAGMLIGR